LLLSNSAQEAGLAGFFLQGERDFGGKLGYSASDITKLNEQLDRGMDAILDKAFGGLK
jgi:hypothetical protein